MKVESGLMMATSPGVALDAKMEGGLLKGLKRAALGGESLFITTYTAPTGGGWVDVCPNLPGDMVLRDVLPERALFMSRGAWVASESSVEIETKWGGFKNLFGGEGGFIVRAHGRGSVLLGCFGALETITLGPGEWLVLDSGHMVAYDETVQFTLRRAADGGSMQSLKSGEGFVFEFEGPGQVMTQTRNPKALVNWLIPLLPRS